MKKALSLLLLCAMTLALCACGGKKEESQPAVDVTDARELLGRIWESYDEEEKFSIIGGDFEHGNMERPDEFALDSVMLDSTLGLPESMADRIDGAASYIHMMNANTFTGAAYHVKSAADVETLCEAIRENVQKRQWMCGFPDKLVVLRAGEYVLSAFGNEELVDNFKTKTLTVFPAAELYCEEPIL